VRRILKDKGYALKANKKDIEGGTDHPDRDEQFRHINMTGLCNAAPRATHPVD
jgi:hypothetical protein